MKRNSVLTVMEHEQVVKEVIAYNVRDEQDGLMELVFMLRR